MTLPIYIFFSRIGSHGCIRCNQEVSDRWGTLCQECLSPSFIGSHVSKQVNVVRLFSAKFPSVWQHSLTSDKLWKANRTCAIATQLLNLPGSGLYLEACKQTTAILCCTYCTKVIGYSYISIRNNFKQVYQKTKKSKCIV